MSAVIWERKILARTWFVQHPRITCTPCVHTHTHTCARLGLNDDICEHLIISNEIAPYYACICGWHIDGHVLQRLRNKFPVFSALKWYDWYHLDYYTNGTDSGIIEGSIDCASTLDHPMRWPLNLINKYILNAFSYLWAWREKKGGNRNSNW